MGNRSGDLQFCGSKEIPGNPNSHTPSLVRAFRFPVVCSTSMQKR